MEQTKQMPSGGCKPNDMENCIEWKCYVLQIKDRYQNGKKSKTKLSQSTETKPLKQRYRRVKNKRLKKYVWYKPQNKPVVATLKSDNGDIKTRLSGIKTYIILLNVHISNKYTWCKNWKKKSKKKQTNPELYLGTLQVLFQ